MGIDKEAVRVALTWFEDSDKIVIERHLIEHHGFMNTFPDGVVRTIIATLKAELERQEIHTPVFDGTHKNCPICGNAATDDWGVIKKYCNECGALLSQE